MVTLVADREKPEKRTVVLEQSDSENTLEAMEAADPSWLDYIMLELPTVIVSSPYYDTKSRTKSLR